MKEYKVEFLKLGMNPDKVANNMENLLNEMTEKGWEFRFNTTGVYWIFEREK